MVMMENSSKSRRRSASIGPWRRSCRSPWSPGGPRCRPEASRCGTPTMATWAGLEVPELNEGFSGWENPRTKWVVFQCAMFDIWIRKDFKYESRVNQWHIWKHTDLHDYILHVYVYKYVYIYIYVCVCIYHSHQLGMNPQESGIWRTINGAVLVLSINKWLNWHVKWWFD